MRDVSCPDDQFDYSNVQVCRLAQYYFRAFWLLRHQRAASYTFVIGPTTTTVTLTDG